MNAITNAEIPYLWEFMSEETNRGLIFDSACLRLYESGLKKKPPYSVLKETVITDYISFVLHKNSFMFEPMTRKVHQFTEHGLAQNMTNTYRNIKKYWDDVGPKVLTLEHLGAGFLVWLAFVTFAIVVFLCEVLYEKLASLLSSHCRVVDDLRRAFGF